MATIVREAVWVCQDCLFWLANGEMPPEASEEEEARILAGERAETDKGLHWAANWDSETGEGIQDFSWRHCECCWSGLGGSRHRMALLGD